MKVYVINLKKNVERMCRIRNRLDQLGVDFIRVEAVYGKEMSCEEKRRSVSKFKWWCVQGTLPRDGEIGCALSHIDVYRRLIASEDECCCVLEDDDTILDGFKEQLQRIETWIDINKSQVVLMTNYTKEKDPGCWSVVRTKGDTSSEAYVITRKAALKILEKGYPVCMPSDGWRFWSRRGVIDLYHAFPTMIPSTWQLPGYKSDVCPEGEHVTLVSNFSWPRVILWKIMRVIGVVLARVFI
jgi:glycosyl transferase family 25